jgi:tetratricopeptide (TPR) repeat protein
MDEFEMTAVPLTLKEMRASARAQWGAARWLWRGMPTLAALFFALTVALPGLARADDAMIKGEVKVVNEANYTRLVFRLEETVDAKVRVAGAILILEFKKPIEIAVDRISSGAPNVISAARRDPDGKAVRIAMANKFRVNFIPAAERLYIDLLPDGWTGVMPGLPQDVVDELASRTRLAEALINKQRNSNKTKTPPAVRVKVATLPTFMRYIFDIPQGATVTPERADGKVTLRFDQQIKWDLADVKATLPPTLESVDAEAEFDSVDVVFQLNGTPDVKSFHEDRSFVVDIGRTADAPPPPQAGVSSRKAAAPKNAAAAGPAIATPETVPAKDTPAIKDAPAKASLKEPAKEASKEAVKETAKETAEEAVKEAAREPLKETAQPMAVLTPPPPVTEMPAPAVAAAPAAVVVAPVAAAPVAAPKQEAEPVIAPAAAAAPVAPPAPVKAEAAPPAASADGTIAALVNATGDSMRIEFPFAKPTSAAVFRRSDTLWLVFDNAPKIDLAALTRGVNSSIRQATFTRGQEGEGIVRLKLARPQLASATSDGPGWVITLGDTATQATGALAIARSIIGKNKASIVVPFEGAQQIHTVTDPDLGDRLMIVTAPAPARGFLKGQDFVELRVLPSTHGVAVQPIADDLTASIDPDKISIGRPGGLSLSAAATGLAQQQLSPGFRALTFDTQTWGFNRQAPYLERQAELMALAAAAVPNKRREARFNLARFYLAREMGAEAKAVLDVALSDQKNGGSDDVTGSVLRSIANLMLDRPEEALKELSSSQTAEQQDAPVWRAIAYAKQGRWADAYAAFKAADNAVRALPVEMQRIAMRAEMRSAIEVRDFAGATRVANEFETMGLPPDFEPSVAVLLGRLYENLGRKEDALVSYRSAAASQDRRSAAQGRLREIEMLNESGDMPRQEVIHELETLTTTWRGDETESGGLRMLAHLYTGDNRYRDAFHVMRTALMAHPNSDMTRKIQDEAATTFDSLFLAGKGDALPPVEALGLFYDFRELTPIGRRGDEMIRRLADRLVSVDLLDQAAELLQHQVDNRLTGAARAQVAAKLAAVYLMNRKPDRALQTLQKTRVAELSNELRDQRLLLEARAISDSGRHELGLEVIAGIKGREAVRLRADILWAAKRWRDSAEQLELMYGNRWREFTPLTDGERADILRAAIGYALSDEQLSLTRLREKYAVKFADGPERRAFDVVSTPIGTGGAEFQDIANKLAATSTLDAFLGDLRTRYPEAAAPEADLAKEPPKEPAKDTAKEAPKTPVAAAGPALPPKVPAGTPLKPDKTPTGSIRPRMPPTLAVR